MFTWNFKIKFNKINKLKIKNGRLNHKVKMIKINNKNNKQIYKKRNQRKNNRKNKVFKNKIK